MQMKEYPILKLSLSELIKKRDESIEFNKKVSHPDYKYNVGLISIEPWDKVIEMKKEMEPQQKINFDE